MRSPRFNRTTLRGGVLCAAAIMSASMLAGCMGGNSFSGRSADRYRYESTSYSPKTISLLDTRTGETAWSVDVPVGQAIQISFSEGTGPNSYRPDEIRWEMAPIDRWIVTPMNTQPCPPSYSRLLVMTERAKPEVVGVNPDPYWNEQSDYEN